jgi:hypothetical protein
LALAVAALLAATVGAVRAAELVMVEQAGCAWCAEWDREIGPVWPNTEAGRRAPLRRVDLRGPWPEDLSGITPRPRFTPTFILVEDGEEIGRIEGHPGEHFFWPMIEALIARLPGGGA